MMRAMVVELLLIMCVFCAGCSAVVLHKGSRSKAASSKDHWHHDVLLGTHEVSEPVNLKQDCENEDWSEVRVENTFIQGLLKVASLSMYDPWTVAVSCASRAEGSKN